MGRLNRLLNGSGVSDDRLRLFSWDEARRSGLITTDQVERRVRLRRGLDLGFLHGVKVVTREGRLKPATALYYYQIIEDERSVLEWHYHPDRTYRDCHLHVEEPIAARPTFGKLHVPTGRVAFEDVLLFLIDEYGVTGASGAKAMLMKERAAFDRTQTWAGRRQPA